MSKFVHAFTFGQRLTAFDWSKPRYHLGYAYDGSHITTKCNVLAGEQVTDSYKWYDDSHIEPYVEPKATTKRGWAMIPQCWEYAKP